MIDEVHRAEAQETAAWLNSAGGIKAGSTVTWQHAAAAAAAAAAAPTSEVLSSSSAASALWRLVSSMAARVW